MLSKILEKLGDHQRLVSPTDPSEQQSRTSPPSLELPDRGKSSSLLQVDTRKRSALLRLPVALLSVEGRSCAFGMVTGLEVAFASFGLDSDWQLGPSLDTPEVPLLSVVLLVLYD